MSRFFDGGTSADRIIFNRGNAPPNQGPITIAILARPTSASATGWAINADDGSFAKWGLLVSGGKPFLETDGGGGPSYTANDWAWFVATKASGSVLPRWHVKDITAGGGWTHSDGPSNVTNLAGVAIQIILGGQTGGGAGTTWRGQIAAVAVWTSVLTDGQVEAACTLSAADLLAGAPGWMVRLNQASTATAVTDDTGGGGNQTSITGTAVDASEPPGWSYALTAGVTPDSVTIPVMIGDAGASIPSTAPAGLSVPVAIGDATVSLGLSVTPDSVSIPVTIGSPIVGTLVIPDSVSIPVTMGDASAGPTVSTVRGSWWTLVDIAQENQAWAEQERAQGPVACPHDGEPLRRDLNGRLHCPFDGWTYQG